VLVAYLCAFACAVCFGLGSVLQSIGAKRVEAGEGLSPKLIARVATQIPYVIGLVIDFFGWILSLVALARLPVFVVQAVVAGSVGFVVLFSIRLEHLRPTRRQIIVLVVLALGLVGLAFSGAPEAAKRLSSGFTVAMAIAAVVIAIAGVVTPRLIKGHLGSSLLAGLAGLAFGGTALCARSLTATHLGFRTLIDPLFVALAAFGLMGLTFFAAALQRGTATVASAWLFTTETVAPAIVGIVVLGDHARAGLGLLAVISFIVTVSAAVVLSLVSPPMES